MRAHARDGVDTTTKTSKTALLYICIIGCLPLKNNSIVMKIRLSFSCLHWNEESEAMIIYYLYDYFLANIQVHGIFVLTSIQFHNLASHVNNCAHNSLKMALQFVFTNNAYKCSLNIRIE